MAHIKPSNKNVPWKIIPLIIGLAYILIGCAPPESPVENCPELECPTVDCPEIPRYEDLWDQSPHADASSESFTHWDGEDPAEIPAECAKCHSRLGFIDFLGIDGSPFGEVDQPVEPGTTITCYVCHNEVLGDLTTVIFPSGEKIRHLGFELACIECHQGRSSTTTLDLALEALPITDEDVPISELSFISSHSISGATPFGSEAKGAYEYVGSAYRGRYIRGDEFFSCIRCHDPHTQEVLESTCEGCHTINGSEIQNIRVDTTDYDSDGDLQEGISFEIEEFQAQLLDAIQIYAETTGGTPIAYDPHAYPYFFIDTDRNGDVNSEEAGYMNRYNAWTPRLLRAAYNYNYAIHDPGAYAHNSDYILQVLFDSILDLTGDTSNLTRP